MTLIDQLGYEILALLFDDVEPLSLVLPEARSNLPDAQSVDVAATLEWLAAASNRGWLTLLIYDFASSEPSRLASAADVHQIATEYAEGVRNADQMGQVLDRPDLWLEISELGRGVVDAIWPEMPEQDSQPDR